MTETISFIQNSLNDLYPAEEIRSFTRLILEHVSGLPHHQFLLNKDRKLSTTEKKSVEDIVARLINAEPIQYILGETEFYGQTFYVEQGVLIPRPETEELVELIVQENRNTDLQILDIGTGSGCIAISLASSLPNSRVTAIDISPEALHIAQKNAKRLKAKVEFIRINILEKEETLKAIQTTFDCIVSNPPYVLDKEKASMEKNVLEYEPHTALFVPDEDPLIFYNRIADLGLERLKPDGKLYFEINGKYGRETVRLLENKGYKEVQLKKDLFGKDRMILAKR